MASVPGARRHLRPGWLEPVIDRFYEAAAHPTLWREALQQLSEAVGAEGSLLLFHEGGGTPRFTCSEGLDASIPTFFAQGWHVHNEAVRRGAAAAMRGEPVQTEWLLFDRDEYRRDPFHTEFLRPHGFAWFAGLFVAQSSRGAVTLSPQRRARDEPFSAGEVELLARLLPHLRRAGQLALAAGGARGEGVLDGFALLDVPAFLLDRTGRVCRMNARAEALLGDGLHLVQGALVARHPSAAGALRRLVQGVTAAGPAHEAEPFGPVPVPCVLGPALLVSGAPLVGAALDAFQQGCAVLTVADPGAGRPRAELLLQRAYGLTRAEAETAGALAAGLDLGEVAARRGVGLETVRSQAKSIGLKTGAHRRGALVALLHRILGSMPDLG